VTGREPAVVRVVELGGISDPRVAVYRSMRRVAELRDDLQFVAEGARVVRQLLESSLRIRSLLLDQRWLDEFAALLATRPEGEITAYLTTKPELEQIVGFHVHQGVMAVAEAPQPPDLDAFLDVHPQHVLVALEGVSNAENVGGMLRTMAGFGADGLLIDPATNDPFVRRAARVSMGAVFHLPVWRSEDLPATLRQVRERSGARVLALHLHGETVTLDDVDLTPPVVLVFGSEATGLSDEVVAACDASVVIPMSGGWSCLNVATSGAVALWETDRRRRASGS